MYIVVEIYMAGKFKVPSAFKKLIDLCKYGNLEISKRKKQTEVCMLLAKIQIWQTPNGYYQMHKQTISLQIF